MKELIRIGNAQAFWGDLPSAAPDLLQQFPELDYLTMDYLAEVSMSILALQQERNPELGYPRDFVQVVQRLSEYWSAGGRCRLIANAGGLNPVACAVACQRVLEESGCRSLKIAVVSGDNVLSILKENSVASGSTREHGERANGNKADSRADGVDRFFNLDDGRPLSTVSDRLVTANAYMGCQGIVNALNTGADIVITGRVADPSMVLAACVHHFGWATDDWNRLAQGTVAGHVLECGTQATGGISTDWLSIPDPAHIGFPFVEIESSGRFVVTKAPGTGGAVTEQTVKEQLVYEIGDPGGYLSPDVRVSFLGLQVRQLERNCVEVVGAIGSPPPATLKVSATYRDGFRAAGSLTIFGHRSVAKARRSAEVILQQLSQAGWSYRDALVECLGNADSVPLPTGVLDTAEPFETVMRVAVESESKAAVEAFSQNLMSLVTAGAQGTTGYAEGRPRVHCVFRYWPCLLSADRVHPSVEVFDSRDTLAARPAPPCWPGPRLPHPNSSGKEAGISSSTEREMNRIRAAELGREIEQESQNLAAGNSEESLSDTRTARLIDVAYGRSGDKGTGANVGILVRNREDYPWLVEWLTVERVQNYFSRLNLASVQRYEMPNLGGVNFLLAGVLSPGIRNDAQGKALAQALLAMPLEQ